MTGPGKYRLYDETQAELLDALAKQNFNGASPELRAELLEFFGHPECALRDQAHAQRVGESAGRA